MTEQYVDYVRPQDNGYKSGVRWAEFTDGAGKGVRFEASEPLFMQALHYGWEDIFLARHDGWQKHTLQIRRLSRSATSSSTSTCARRALAARALAPRRSTATASIPQSPSRGRLEFLLLLSLLGDWEIRSLGVYTNIL